uniref:lipid-A-disaccharide synthase n=1 Tax=Rhizophora mucronata TaxID=61149 RepID=A0A2P2MRF0_RHIMU
MSSLKKLCPVPVCFSGVGGSAMSNEGVKPLFPMEDISVMGIRELIPHLYNFRVKLKETIEAALLFWPHVVVTVDLKGFFFRLLKQLRGNWESAFCSLIWCTSIGYSCALPLCSTIILGVETGRRKTQGPDCFCGPYVLYTSK